METEHANFMICIDALEKIANPLNHLQKEAEKRGDQLNGVFAHQLCNDANWLRQIAKGVLEEIAAEKWKQNQAACMEVCTGYNESDCCGAKIKFHDICSACGEHCGTQCDDCELKENCISINNR